ncbi:MAG: hypothetical protein U9O18_10640, partial [Chloroflexota bacterium]|nr:hypothetical protein [Chloroflexota bacterium]
MVRMHAAVPASWILGTVLLPNGVLARALVHVASGRIEGVEERPSTATERALRRDGRGVILGGREVLAPAFLDIHCHGAGGGEGSGDASSLDLMASTLLA